MKKRALISVYDKQGIPAMAAFLRERNWEILSTGGTFRFLEEQGFSPIEISRVTGTREMLDGRVKTLHPAVHGGILCIRSNKEHQKNLEQEGIVPIDMVIVNLYPFFDQIRQKRNFEQSLEFIDIGGPAMLRSGAKNFQDVIVICDPADYGKVMDEIRLQGDLSPASRRSLAGKVFNLTAAYDSAVSRFFLGDEKMPGYFSPSWQKKADLPYGENPHQKAAFYTNTSGKGVFCSLEQLGGRALSFNNIRDLDTAWKVVSEFDYPVCCALKHSTPCGVAGGTGSFEAYTRAFSCDPVSIFGGVVALNRKISARTALEMGKTFLEIVAAPAFTEEALSILKKKKNLRIIRMPEGSSEKAADPLDVLTVDGGALVQERDLSFSGELKTVTRTAVSPELKEDLVFAQKVVKHVKSNAIVVARAGCASGIGTGQTNRIQAARQAVERAGDGVVLASDAFFPFDDVVHLCAEKGIRAIIQPGGSIRDEDSVKACNAHGIAMVFTGMRHFKH